MKVTRKKTGYTIRCTDGEFEALKALVASAEAADPKRRSLTGIAKGGHTRRTNGGAFLRVDTDNRA